MARALQSLVLSTSSASSSFLLPRPSLFGDELRSKRSNVAFCQRQSPVGAAVASSAEPKWKQKLAAADEHAAATRQATALAQEEYFKKQAEQRRQQAGAGLVEKLDSMEYTPYLTEEGLIADITKPDIKASVYAIFDDAKTLQYVGVTRQVYQSMRLHFARFPSKCFYVKVQHLSRPSRALLEGIRDQWIADNGSPPPGNDNGEMQNRWENPLDCKVFMTDEEMRLLEEAAPGPPKAAVLKNVARRIEKTLMAAFEERKCTDKLRFEPKLKDRGLLDLKGVVIKPDSSVPTSTPKSKEAQAPSAA
ncbi:hypothetical protein MPTK1_5g02430 [Marchantia polymorpha subsp. ruderalis]|nr:hypothetical protein MARPO_0147s0036 [Marchantia polymorpha]BBN10299.1 hypothetical protein Mp_5g02430 [Marchantia polymorpha subsp. ruderalis]|eukprot:PTQ29160.1 hypothetical protein MARPO_0147s0036 [Marchantia polymorpha]